MIVTASKTVSTATNIISIESVIFFVFFEDSYLSWDWLIQPKQKEAINVYCVIFKLYLPYSSNPTSSIIRYKKAKEIKLTNIFDAVDEKVKTVQCKKDSKKGCNGKSTKCLTHNLWDELENHINNFFKEKSLEDLVKDNIERRI